MSTPTTSSMTMDPATSSFLAAADHTKPKLSIAVIVVLAVVGVVYVAGVGELHNIYM